MPVCEQVNGFFIPSVTLMGIGAHKELPAKVRSLGGTKPLLVTDKGMTAIGMTQKIVDLLVADGIHCVVFDETVPNPTDKNVADGLAVYQKEQCDSLITLGGGSAHDCGKGIGLVSTNGGTIHDYEGLDKSEKGMPPYIAVNTTAGTASEMTRCCVITNTARKVKMAIIDWHVTPAIALDDPLLMMGMPPALTAATGMDALTHAIEAYVSIAATHLTDACAEKAIKLVSKHLRAAVANGQDIHAREGMCYAQYLAGMAFNNASVGHVHAMAHQLGGYYNLPHGECNAILLPFVEERNLIAKMDRFAEMAAWLGEDTEGISTRDTAKKCMKAIRALSEDVGIPSGLKELGKRYGKDVKIADIPIMTENAQKDACVLTNPRTLTHEEVMEIYEAAM